MPRDFWIPIGQGHEVNMESAPTEQPSPEPVPTNAFGWRPMAEIRPVSAEQVEIAMRSARHVNTWSNTWNAETLEPVPQENPVPAETIGWGSPQLHHNEYRHRGIVPMPSDGYNINAESTNEPQMLLRTPNGETICKWEHDGTFIFEKVANVENTLKFVDLLKGINYHRQVEITDVRSPNLIKKPDSRCESYEQWKEYALKLEAEISRLRSVVSLVVKDAVSSACNAVC